MENVSFSIVFLVEATRLELAISSTRNWRDTTFATPRKYGVEETDERRGDREKLAFVHHDIIAYERYFVNNFFNCFSFFVYYSSEL